MERSAGSPGRPRVRPCVMMTTAFSTRSRADFPKALVDSLEFGECACANRRECHNFERKHDKEPPAGAEKNALCRGRRLGEGVSG